MPALTRQLPSLECAGPFFPDADERARPALSPRRATRDARSTTLHLRPPPARPALRKALECPPSEALLPRRRRRRLGKRSFHPFATCAVMLGARAHNCCPSTRQPSVVGPEMENTKGRNVRRRSGEKFIVLSFRGLGAPNCASPCFPGGSPYGVAVMAVARALNRSPSTHHPSVAGPETENSCGRWRPQREVNGANGKRCQGVDGRNCVIGSM